MNEAAHGVPARRAPPLLEDMEPRTTRSTVVHKRIMSASEASAATAPALTPRPPPASLLLPAVLPAIAAPRRAAAALATDTRRPTHPGAAPAAPAPPAPPAAPAPSHSPAEIDEEQAKDLVTFRQGAKRRFRSILLIGAALYTTMLTGLVDVPHSAAAAIIGGGLAANALLTALATSPRTYRWWYRYLFAVLDTTQISCAVLLFGQPSLVTLYFLAIVPYSFDRGKSLGYFTTGVATLEFLAASWGYEWLHPDASVSRTWTGIAVLLLLIVASQVVPIPSRLIRRIRRTRHAISEAERGNLLVRADARATDELGFMERSFNSMLEELGQLIGTVQREADDVARYAEQVAGATQALSATGSDFSAKALTLAGELETQRGYTQGGARRTTEAHATADRLRERAGSMEKDTQALVDAAGTSRDAVGRAARTLVTIGGRVRDTSVTVGRLAEASEQVGEFVDAVARIARQTNLLALNAAIEAARAGEHGKGFAVVAEEVRTLAEESARAAKAIATTIAGVREHIATAVHSMTTGEREVRDVGQVAAEADAALSAILVQVERIADMVTETASVSRSQSQAMAELATSIGGIEQVSVDAAAHAQAASQVAAQQTASLEALSGTSRQLAGLAERLRGSMGRFAVSDGEGEGK